MSEVASYSLLLTPSLSSETVVTVEGKYAAWHHLLSTQMLEREQRCTYKGTFIMADEFSKPMYVFLNVKSEKFA